MSIISNNNAIYGGGIAAEGTTTIAGSTISGNNANLGGGILNTGTATVTGSSILQNTAQTSAGGIYSAKGCSLTVQGASTISSNNAIYGGGIANDGTATLTDSTVSSGTAPT